MINKTFLNKLKIGFTTLALLGFTSFNSIKAQDYQPKYNTTTHYIIKEIQKENSFITPKILDNTIDISKKIITKQNYTEHEAKDLMRKIDSSIFKQNPNLNNEYFNYNKSLIYLAIAEENNLPLYPALALNHMFVRWDAERDGHDASNPNNRINQGDFNWDPIFLKFIKDNEYTAIASGLMDFEAIEYTNKSIEINPDYPGAYQIRGTSLINLGDILKHKEFYEAAIEDYNKAQELNFDPENHYGIGFNLYRLGRYDEAEQYYNKALNIFQDEPRYLAARYLLYTKTNQKEKAERDFKKLELLKEKSQKSKKN